MRNIMHTIGLIGIACGATAAVIDHAWAALFWAFVAGLWCLSSWIAATRADL